MHPAWENHIPSVPFGPVHEDPVVLAVPSSQFRKAMSRHGSVKEPPLLSPDP